jgi:hypothetical protein
MCIIFTTIRNVSCCNVHERKNWIFNLYPVFSSLTILSVLTSPAAVDQIPGGQQNDFQVGPSQTFFLPLLFKSCLRIFCCLMFLSSCLFRPALGVINILTSNSHTTASDQQGMRANVKRKLPESKSNSSYLASQFCCFQAPSQSFEKRLLASCPYILLFAWNNSTWNMCFDFLYNFCLKYFSF